MTQRTFASGRTLSVLLLVIAFSSACTPHFNRAGKKLPLVPPLDTVVGLARPLQDLTAQGGGTPGTTPNFRLTRVAIGGNIQRKQGLTPSSQILQGGPGVPR